MTNTLQQYHPREYENARHLIESGVPVFLAKPSPSFPTGGHGDTGYLLPVGWQTTEPDLSVLDQWVPGYALCAVMGHVVDGLDVDTNKGGSVPESIVPRSYGTQHTPSGGTHDLIAPLGLRSRDGVLPGVDYKGGVGSVGHGFLFLAPTSKRSKATGEVGQYEWETDPMLDSLVLLDAADQSGSGLAERIQSGRAGTDSRPEYTGPSYGDLTPDRQEQADTFLEDTLFDWKVRLGDAAGWEEGQRDHVGRGWEALARDAAWAVASLAVCPWVGLTEDKAQSTYEALLPDQIATDPKCKGKWYDGILEKAAAKPANQPPWWTSIFFEQTPTLKHIQQAAHCRIVSSEGLLALVLARVLAEVPPQVMLPPTVASIAGLNLGVALVAGSGGGKSASMNVSRELLGIHGVNQESIEKGMGSGEGLIDCFLTDEKVQNDKGEWKKTGKRILKDDPRMIYHADEVAQMAAVGSERKGSTLSPLLRTALTGGALQISNADAGGRSRNVARNVYRLVTVVGVQPERSDVLLSEESQGTPQRFLWASAIDRNQPREQPEWPGALEWDPPSKWPDLIEYPRHIADEIVDAHYRKTKGETTAQDGHVNLTRLKVAFALAVLHGETKISDQWWAMSGVLINRSRQIQDECKAVLGQVRDRIEVSRATRQAKAQVEAQAVVSEIQTTRAAESVLRRLQKKPGEMLPWSRVRPHQRLREGLTTEEILDELREVDGVKIERATGPQGQKGWEMGWFE